MEFAMPKQFGLGIQDKVGGSWMTWAAGLRRERFARRDDGSYLYIPEAGAQIYFRALSIDDRGVSEHVDGDGYGHVYRHRPRSEPHGSRGAWANAIVLRRRRGQPGRATCRRSDRSLSRSVNCA